MKDKRIQQKIKRFKMKQAQRALFFADVRLCDCVLNESVCGLSSFFFSGDASLFLCGGVYLCNLMYFRNVFFLHMDKMVVC